MTLGHALFKNGEPVITAESVMVFIDIDSRKAATIPDGVRRAAEADVEKGGD